MFQINKGNDDEEIEKIRKADPSRENPKCPSVAGVIRAVRISTAGYRQEMGALQDEHLPFRMR